MVQPSDAAATSPGSPGTAAGRPSREAVARPAPLPPASFAALSPPSAVLAAGEATPVHGSPAAAAPAPAAMFHAAPPETAPRESATVQRSAVRGAACWRLDLSAQPSRATRAALRTVLVLFAPLLRLEGGKRLASLPEPVIFAFNHNNSIESVVVPALLIAHRRGRSIRFAVDWMFLHLPLVGWLLRRVDPIPVYTKPFRWHLFEGYRRARRHLSPLEGCRRALEAGESVGLFPEGTRNRDPHRLRRGRSGLGHLALAAPPGVPVVPVGIDYPSKERLGRVPRLGRTVVRVGEPLDFAEERAAACRPEATEAERRRLARSVVDRTMAALAVLGGKAAPPGPPVPPRRGAAGRSASSPPASAAPASASSASVPSPSFPSPSFPSPSFPDPSVEAP